MSTINLVENTQEVTLTGVELVKAENVLDFSLTPCISGDVVNALKIPANVVVTHVGAKVLTAESALITLGDANNTDGWIESVSVGTTGCKLGSGAYAVVQGKAYETADTLDLIVPSGAGLSAGKISVFATYFKLEN